MKKYIAITLVSIVIAVMVTLHSCSFKADDWAGHMPASWGKYKIDTITNEPLLLRQYPDAEQSGCGLADDDFIKHARSKIDYEREFQFIVFTNGKPLVGEKCLRTALIFYLK